MLHVDSLQLAPIDRRVAGLSIDAPEVGSETHHVLDITGSVVSASEPSTAVSVVCDGVEVAQAVVGVPRPDLAQHFPGSPHAGVAGFQASVSGIDLPQAWTVDVVATIDERSLPIATIAGTRGRLQSSHEPTLQPVILVTLGRTGSIWTTYLLSRHPELIAYRPFDFEPRMAWYWMSVLKTLARPYSHLRPISPGSIQDDPTWWAGLARPDVTVLPEEELRAHFDRDHVDAVATFCHSRLDAFYSSVAATAGKRARGFVEKAPLQTPEYRMLFELYPEAKKVVLVRDLRDVFCSVHDFGTRRGWYGQGRQFVDSEDEYVQRLARDARRWVKEWKDGGFLLRYEDIIRGPEDTLRSTLEFIGVDASPRVIDAMCAEATAIERPQMAAHRTSPSTEASIGRWRRDLDPAIRAAIEREAGDEMVEFGYEIGP